MKSALQIESAEYSDDLLSVVIHCPVCANKHHVHAVQWPQNVDGVFTKHLWYPYKCHCEQDISFKLVFDSFTLVVGKKYLVIKPAHSFGEIDGELVKFEETRTEVQVLPKPKTVIACDGETEVE